MSIPTIEIELFLLDWSDSARTGPKLVFAVRDRDELKPFELATTKKGKRAGQRYMAVLVPMADDEQPEQEERPKGGALSKLAAQWCNDDRFQEWLLDRECAVRFDPEGGEPITGAEVAAQVVRSICGVESRAEIDNNDEARRKFNDRIREPYRAYLQEQGG